MEARTLRGRRRRGKPRPRATWIASWPLWLALVGCAPAVSEASSPIAPTGRALAPLTMGGLRLLPAAAVPPPPTGPAPAFARPEAPRPGWSIGPSNAGSLVGAAMLPEGHPSLRIRPIAARRGATFGTPALVAMLVRAAERVAREFPGSALWAGDLSLPGGGALAPHNSHTSGRDVDLSFYVSRRSGDGLTPADGPEMRFVDGAGGVADSDLVFDDARNWALVEALLEDPGAAPQWIFVAAHLRERLLAHGRSVADARLVARAEVVLAQPGDSSPHADHFHVRIYCGLDERLQGCLDAAPFHPWVDRHDAALAHWLDGLLPFLEEPRLPETREAIERIVRMNAEPAIPHLERLIAKGPDPTLADLARDALDFLRGRRTPEAWKKWRADDARP